MIGPMYLRPICPMFAITHLLDLREYFLSHLLAAIDELLAPWLKAHGQGAYRAGQVRRWLFARRAQSFAEMTALPQSLREELAADFTLWTSTIARHTQADDGTEKLLLTLAD